MEDARCAGVETGWVDEEIPRILLGSNSRLRKCRPAPSLTTCCMSTKAHPNTEKVVLKYSVGHQIN